MQRLLAIIISFVIVVSIILFSCSNKPTYDNPFDPNSDYQLTQLQGELVLTQLTDSQVKLDWHLNSTIIGNYKIKRKINSGNYEDLATVGKDTNTFTDNGLLTTNIYHYQIIGTNGDILTEPIANSISTTFEEIANFTIQQENLYTVKLTWSYECSYEEGYIIERREIQLLQNSLNEISITKIPRKISNDTNKKIYQVKGIEKENSRDYIQIADLSANTYEYVDNTLLPNHIYEYRIYAYTTYNESSSLQIQQFMEFPAPDNFNIEQNDVHTFTLTWEDIEMGEQQYVIERKIDNGVFAIIADNILPSTESFTDDINLRNTFENVYYRIYANYENETSQISQISSNITFSAISELLYNKLNIHSIELSWIDTNLNEDGFIIEKKVDSGNWEFLASVTDLSYTDDEAEINHNLQYRVQAYCGMNYTNFVGTEIIDNTIPSPTNLDHENLTLTSIQLTWQDNSNGEDGFKIDKKIGTASWQVEYSVVGEDIEEWIDASAEINEDLQYRIYAYSGNNQSDSIETGVIDNSIPVPTNLQYEQLTIASIQLTWEDNSNGEDGFKIDRKVGSNPWQEDYAIIIENIVEWTDTSAEVNEDIRYRIYTYSGNNQSDSIETGVIDNSIPAATNLQITQDDVHTFSLIWNDHSEGEEGFSIERKIDEGNYILVGTNTENDTTYTDDINQTRDTYETICYKIKTFYQTFYSDSLESSYSIDFPSPTNLTYESLTINSIELTWEDNSNGEDGFKIDKKVGTSNWQTDYAIIIENIEEWTDTSAEINEDIQYRVYAYSDNNQSDSIETGIIENTFLMPNNFQIEYINLISIGLTWSDNSNGEEGFIIDRKINNEDWQINYALLQGNCTEYIDSSICIYENDYSYRVYAFYNEDYSDSALNTYTHFEPIMTGWLDTGSSYPYRIHISENYAYMSLLSDGLKVVDVTNPYNPTNCGSCNVSSDAVGIYVMDNYAYLSCISSGLQIINVNNPYNPQIIGSCATPGTAFDNWISDDFAYIADGSSGLQIIDISEPSTSQIISTCNTPGYSWGIFISESYAYIADRGNGLQIIDISNPTSPYIMGSCETPNYAEDVYVLNNYAYVADGDGGYAGGEDFGMYVFDISDPLNPISVGQVITPESVQAIKVVEGYAFLSIAWIPSMQSGLFLTIDIRDFNNLHIVNSLELESDANDVFIENGYAYVTLHNRGLAIIKISP